MSPDSPLAPPPNHLRLGLLGDLHGAFDAVDARQLDAQGYGLLLFTGDLGPGTLEADLRVARAIARLRTPVLVMPGNNDCAHAPQIRAEFGHQSGLVSLLRQSGAKHRSPLLEASGNVTWGGYGLHPLGRGATGVTLITGRPYSMGGPELSFAEELRERHGIGSMEESRARLISLVEAVQTRAVLFLAHNGPTGLGEARDALWGKDFSPEAGDHGDPDLGAALGRARELGLGVLGVIAGHMHHRLRGGGERRWREQRGETLYLNPARVPRIVAGSRGLRRHHVELRLSDQSLEAEERWIEEEG